MNKSQWESRLAEKQRKEKALWAKIRKLQTEIADCFTNIKGCRRREAIAMRKIPKRERRVEDGAEI